MLFISQLTGILQVNFLVDFLKHTFQNFEYLNLQVLLLSHLCIYNVFWLCHIACGILIP